MFCKLQYISLAFLFKQMADIYNLLILKNKRLGLSKAVIYRSRNEDGLGVLYHAVYYSAFSFGNL